jgi:hypothetical protein
MPIKPAAKEHTAPNKKPSAIGTPNFQSNSANNTAAIEPMETS